MIVGYCVVVDVGYFLYHQNNIYYNLRHKKTDKFGLFYETFNALSHFFVLFSFEFQKTKKEEGKEQKSNKNNSFLGHINLTLISCSLSKFQSFIEQLINI